MGFKGLFGRVVKNCCAGNKSGVVDIRYMFGNFFDNCIF